MTINKILGTILMLILPCILLGQTFESLTSVRRTRGMTEDQGRIVLFGNGLIWINSVGDIQEELALTEGMTISDIWDVTADGLGGLWILTKTELGHLSADRKIKPVFHISTFDNSEARKLKLLPDGTLLVLLRNRIIEVKQDLTYKLKYQSPSADIGHFNVFDVDRKGNIYIGSFFRIYVLESDQNLKIIDLSRQNNIQRIQVTEEQRVIVLEYKNLFELVDGELITLLARDQLSRGIKFYEGEFKSMQDYWLYANEGNVFHFLDGKWKNYTPPPGIKTGSLGESILRTSNGNLWMGLRSTLLLRFDGTKWHNLTLKETASDSKPLYVQTLLDGTIYASEQNTTRALVYNGTDFRRIPGLPDERLFNVKKDLQGNWSWTTEKGIFNYRNGRVNNLITLSASVPYEFFGDEILFADDHKLKIFKDGKTIIVDNGQHHLGWNDVYGIQFFRMFDKKVCAISSTHHGVISCYDGKAWEKIITIEGKMIGSIFNMHTLGDKTYIITNAGAVALYDVNGWRWIHWEPISQRKLSRSFLTLDDLVWYTQDGAMLRCVGADKSMQSFEIPIKDSKYGLDGIIHIADNSYLLYTYTGLIRMELPEQ